MLQTMPPRALEDDLVRSRLALEAVLGERVHAIAYPVGNAPSYNAAIRDAVRRAGYRVAFSNRSGVNRLSRLDALDTKRINVDRTFTDAFFASVLAVPSLAYSAPRR